MQNTSMLGINELPVGKEEQLSDSSTYLVHEFSLAPKNLFQAL